MNNKIILTYGIKLLLKKYHNCDPSAEKFDSHQLNGYKEAEKEVIKQCLRGNAEHWTLTGQQQVLCELEEMIDMRTSEQSIGIIDKCELCGQKINPTVKIYKDHTRLCKTCFHHMEIMPEIVGECVKRMMIGNVL